MHTFLSVCAIKQIREAVVISEREGKNGAFEMLPFFPFPWRCLHGCLFYDLGKNKKTIITPGKRQRELQGC
jgi:hypothetical protein